jgi:peptidoglycan hydrolase-like protein with peptidoglycan-binding domain
MFLARTLLIPVLLGLGLSVAVVGSAGAGETEKWAQESLNALGYEAGAADGIFGRRSEAALTAFQTDKALPATGKIDKDTIRALQVAKRCDTGAYKEETQQPLFGAVFCNDLAGC